MKLGPNKLNFNFLAQLFGPARTTTINILGLIWPDLACSHLFWPVMACSVLFWSSLAYPGMASTLPRVKMEGAARSGLPLSGLALYDPVWPGCAWVGMA